MPSTPSGRALNLVSGPRTRQRPAAVQSDNLGVHVSPRLRAKHQPPRVKKAKRIQCPNTNDQPSPGAERLVVPTPNGPTRSTRSILPNAGPGLMTVNQALPHEKTALLRAASILNGTPILISRKIVSPNPETKLHNLEIVSLELFSAEKKTLALRSALIQTTTLSSIREQDHKSDASFSPATAIRPGPRRQSEDLAPQLLTTLEDSLGNTAILPRIQARRVHMHYTDNEVSPEETMAQMAQMARYAYAPSKATYAKKPKE